MTDQPRDPFQPLGGPPPQGPPPGWYPDPEDASARRWWSGRDWTQHAQPAPGQQASAAPPLPAGPQPAGRRSRKRGGSHWVRNIFAGIGALVVLIVIIAAATSKGSGSGSGTAAPASSPAPAATAAATSAKPSQSAKAAAARTVATFSGSGQSNTRRFTVTATWKLVYSFSCSAFGYPGNFQVYEDGGSDFNGVSVNDLAMSKSASTWAYNDAGTHFLQVNSECSWKMKVVDEP